MLSDLIEQEAFFRLAADRVFFFGLYNPGPDGSYGQEATHNYIFDSVANTMLDGAESNITGYDADIEILQYIGLTGPRVFGNADNALFTVPASSNRVLITTLADVSNSFAWLNHDDRAEPDLKKYAALIVYEAIDTMLNQSVVGGDVQDVYQFFNLSEVVSTGATDFGRVPSQSVIKDHVAFKITDGPTCPDKEFTPFVGASGDTSYGNIDETTPVLGSGTLTLTYPYTSPTLTLTLKNPEFGDQNVLDFAKIDRKTRGGTRKIFADNDWSEAQTLQLTVSNLSACKVPVADIVNFLNTSLGKEVGLLDWHGRQWRGVISVPDTDITQEASGTRVVITYDGELA